MVLSYIAVALVGGVSCAIAAWPYLGTLALLTMPIGASLAAGLTAMASLRLARPIEARDDVTPAGHDRPEYEVSDVTPLVEALRSIRRLADKEQAPPDLADGTDRDRERRSR